MTTWHKGEQNHAAVAGGEGGEGEEKGGKEKKNSKPMALKSIPASMNTKSRNC